ncbi:MAG TPA: hypothetical protein IAB83_01780 [Candidatus Faecousia faecavium]|nr:hypothetical protein [Candidatus Faecousia faecavium]
MHKEANNLPPYQSKTIWLPHLEHGIFLAGENPEFSPDLAAPEKAGQAVANRAQGNKAALLIVPIGPLFWVCKISFVKRIGERVAFSTHRAA